MGVEVKRFLSILLIGVLICVASISNSAFAESYVASSSESWNDAQWIWNSETSTNNSFVSFNKDFNLDSVPESAITKIAVDTKYSLYINGTLVVRDGELKRGTADGTFYDQIDIAPYLTVGTNRISVLAIYWGGGGHTYNTSGEGGFLFDATIDDKNIVSDSSWKATLNPAYTNDPTTPSGTRSYEGNVEYIASNELIDNGSNHWYNNAYDDSSWGNAVELGEAGDAPWNSLWERQTPMFKDSDLSDYVSTDLSTSDYAGTYDIRQYGTPYNATFDLTTSTTSDILFGITDYQNYYQLKFDFSNSSLTLEKITDGITSDLDIFYLASVSSETTHAYSIDVSSSTVQVAIDGIDIGTFLGLSIENGGFGFDGTGTLSSLIISNDTDTLYTFDGTTNDFSNTSDISGSIESSIYNFSNLAILSTKDTNGIRYTCALPDNIQFYQSITVTAPAGKKIVMKTNTNYVSGAEVVFVTKGDSSDPTKAVEQTFEAPYWTNGNIEYYDIPDGVTVNSLQYRETGYDTEFTNFSCSDSFLNDLWSMGQQTLYICMRDTYMDSPDRERASCVGDVNNDIMNSFYAFDTNALALAKQTIIDEDGNALDSFSMTNATHLSVLPAISVGDKFENTQQSLALIDGYWNTYLYSGDMELLESYYPIVQSYLGSFTVNDDGTVYDTSVQYDWGENVDEPALDTLMYYLALSDQIKMAQELGKTADVTSLQETQTVIKDNFEANFWQESLQAYDSDSYLINYPNEVDDRVNALAVYVGLVPNTRYEAIDHVLTTYFNCGPYFERYCEEALYMIGYASDAQERMHTMYAELVDDKTINPYGTLWENWPEQEGDGDSHDHAWGAGSIIALSKYAAGIAPLTAGYETYEINPQLGSLTYVEQNVDTVKGEISVDVEKDITNNTYSLKVVSPEDTIANIYIPISSNQSIYVNGVLASEAIGVTYVSTSDGKALYQVSTGTYDFETVND